MVVAAEKNLGTGVFKMLINFSKLCCAKTILTNVLGHKLFKRNFSTNSIINRNKFEYLLIVDFEATCDYKKKIQQEIIEFPCLKINISNLTEVSRFHHYVRPVLNPTLTTFCVELTGILQEMIEEEKTFPEVMELFEEWRQKEHLTDENSIYITSGNWDFGHMFPRQCAISGLKLPSHALEWADIKQLYGNMSGNYKSSFIEIIKELGLEFQGRQHSGIDDCINIFHVLKKMILLGVEIKPTSRLVVTDNKRKIETVL